MKINPNAPANSISLDAMTVRAEIASRVLAALYADPAFAGSHQEAAVCAVCSADALIAELNREELP